MFRCRPRLNPVRQQQAYPVEPVPGRPGNLAGRQGAGIPAKGLTGQAYEGHYFWDTEIYVLPFLSYTQPRIARNLLRFRHSMLGRARERAAEMSQRGALFPWRTINGEEASSNFQQGTAQYHINADIAYAIRRYANVQGDPQLLGEIGAEMLVETARLWEDLGFYGADEKFHLHGVTGPDEYTTVVNDNTYTNLMARLNLNFAASTVRQLRQEQPGDYTALAHQVGLRPGEIESWERAAAAMHVPFDAQRRIHPQDDTFLNREKWDLDATPREKFPLLLHYHPLVIYRHQVLKQADIVLAMFLLGNEFSEEQKRRNFDYYDPITTGDSSLSACVQGIVAAEIGKERQARRFPVRLARWTSAMSQETPRTESTSPRPPACGPRWCSGSAACATSTASCPSSPACRMPGTARLLAALPRPAAAGAAHPPRGALPDRGGRAADHHRPRRPLPAQPRRTSHDQAPAAVTQSVRSRSGCGPHASACPVGGHSLPAGEHVASCLREPCLSAGTMPELVSLQTLAISMTSSSPAVSQIEEPSYGPTSQSGSPGRSPADSARSARPVPTARW